MIPSVLNSANFEFTFKTKDLEQIVLDPVLISDFKMYTDAEGVYLLLQFTSLTALLDLVALHSVKHVSLEFIDDNSQTIGSYNFETLGYSWEFEGNRAEVKPLTWQAIFAIKRETIKIKHDTTKDTNSTD